MKIMLDTNVLISAFVFDGSVGKLLDLLFERGDDLYISEYVDSEFKEKLKLRWKDKAANVYKKYRSMCFVFCRSTDEILCDLRDPKDNPVLSDAIYHNVDVLVTGDKDFLDANITQPSVLSPQNLYRKLTEK